MDPSASRPNKRRKTKAIRRVTEGDDALADGYIVKTSIKQTSNGVIEEKTEVPVWCNEPQASPSVPADAIIIPSSSTDRLDNLQEDAPSNASEFYRHDPQNEDTPRIRRTQGYYIQQFVDRVQPLLKALLSREVLPSSNICGRCPNGNHAIWRCRDCTAATLHCRACIRDCHIDCPTHRIEVWTGRYFRRAELWEVGLYILVRHHTDPNLCRILEFQKNVLASFQRSKDLKEQQNLEENSLHRGNINRGYNYRGENQITAVNVWMKGKTTYKQRLEMI
jgi:hypothetical protein